MFAARTRSVVSSALRSSTHNTFRSFHASKPIMVKVGDSIPDIELMEDSPGNKVSIPKLLKGKGLIIGVPAAFSKIAVFFVLLLVLPLVKLTCMYTTNPVASSVLQLWKLLLAHPHNSPKLQLPAHCTWTSISTSSKYQCLVMFHLHDISDTKTHPSCPALISNLNSY